MDQKQSVGSTSRSRSPIRKNARGKRVDSSKRQLIINAYKSRLELDPHKSLRTIREELSKELGIGTSTISQTITVYNRTKTVISPIRTRVKLSSRIKFEEFQRNVVRKHVHSFWLKRTIPTVDKIYQVVSKDESLPSISKTNLFNLLKEMNFEYSKRSHKGALTEKNEIVVWRRQFLEDLRKYRGEGRHLYYLDETWINVGECAVKPSPDPSLGSQTTGAVQQSEKAKNLVVLNIGSKDGFVPGALLCLESKKPQRDYLNEINGDIFYKWMERVFPLLKKNCVIIMDSASCHSVKIDEAPTSQTTKANIIKWLKDKNEIIDRPMVIPQLLEIVKRIKPHHESYVIDELGKQYDCIILRLPPCHNELNPIELAWSSVKDYVRRNNKTRTLNNVKQLLIEGVERVNADMWMNFIRLTNAEETKLFKVDFIIDEVLSKKMESEAIKKIKDTSSDDSSTIIDEVLFKEEESTEIVKIEDIPSDDSTIIDD